MISLVSLLLTTTAETTTETKSLKDTAKGVHPTSLGPLIHTLQPL